MSLDIVFKNDDTRWGSGTGAGVDGRLTSLQADENNNTLKTAVETLQENGPRSIDSVEQTDTGFIFHMSDDTDEGPFQIPFPTLTSRGPWQNSTHYDALDLTTVAGVGLILVNIGHTTDAAPAEFDIDATDGTTANNKLYSLVFPLQDMAYDVSASITGTIPGDSRTILQIVLPRSIRMDADLPDAVFYMRVGPQTNTLSFVLYKNDDFIGSVSFAPADNLTDGSQIGTVTFDDDVTFAAKDIFRIEGPGTADVALTDGTEATDLSATIPATRLDV